MTKRAYWSVYRRRYPDVSWAICIILSVVVTGAAIGDEESASARVRNVNLFPDGDYEALTEEQLSEHWSIETDDVLSGKQALRFHSDEPLSDESLSGLKRWLDVDDSHVYVTTVATKGINFARWEDAVGLYLRMAFYDQDGQHIETGASSGDPISWWWGKRSHWINHAYYFRPPPGAVRVCLQEGAWRAKGTVLIDQASLMDLGEAPEPREIQFQDKTFKRLPTPEPFAKPTFTSRERQRGGVVFVRSEPGFVFPTSYPSRAEITTQIETFAAQGQIHGLSFALYPLRDLTQLSVELTDLVSRKGDRLARSQLELRRIRFWPQIVAMAGGSLFAVHPELLEPMSRTDGGNVDRFEPLPTEYDWDDLAWKRVEEAVMTANEPVPFWLSVRVPEGCAPGIYSGYVRIRAGNSRVANLRVQLEVLPFALQRPQQRWGLYCDDRRWDVYTDKDLEAELSDLYEYGFEVLLCALDNVVNEQTTATEGLRLQADEVAGEKQITGVSCPRLVRVLRAMRKVGMRGPVILGLDPGMRRHVTDALGLRLNSGPESPYGLPWDEQMKAGYVQALRLIGELVEREGAGIEWALALEDEPAGNRLPLIRQQYVLAKQAGVKTYVTTNHKVLDKAGVPGPVEFLCYPRLYDGAQNPARLEYARKHNANYWYYASGCYTSQDGKIFANRFLSGFQFVKSRAACHMSYTFQWLWYGNDPFNDFDPRIAEVRAWCIVYPPKPELGWSGLYVPTLQWEGLREGFLDACYYHTLSHYIAEAKKLGTPETIAAVQEAEKAQSEGLAEVPWSILLNSSYQAGPFSQCELLPGEFHNREANALRRMLAEHVQKLHKLIEAGPGETE